MTPFCISRGEFHYAIHEAKEKDSGRAVLWKTIKKSLDPQQGDEPTWVLRKDLATLRDISHPNLARLIGCFEDFEYFYLVYERLKFLYFILFYFILSLTPWIF